MEIKMREVALPSGAKLAVAPAPFAESQALMSAFLGAIKGMGFKLEDEEAFSKLAVNIISYSFTNQAVRAALDVCLSRCTYNGNRVTNAVFEDQEARQDYPQVCYECAVENLAPFGSGLYAVSSSLSKTIESSLKQ